MQEREEQEEELKVKEAELIRGNPLLNNGVSFGTARRLVALSPSACRGVNFDPFTAGFIS